LGGDFTHSGAFALGRSIAVAPGARNTLAVSKGYMQTFLCGDGDLGVAIFDDATQRPITYAPSNGVYGIKSIAWGPTGSTLYGEDFYQALYAITVDATGASSGLRLNPNWNPDQADVDIGRDLYFDRVTGHLLDSFGHVFDTASGTNIGPISIPGGSAANGCGTPLAGRTTDPTTGKVFFVTYEAESGPSGRLTVSTFNGATLALIDTAQILETPNPTDYGYPLRVVRLAPDRLAIATSVGYVIIFEGPMFSP
jgi:hypothetical protein